MPGRSFTREFKLEIVVNSLTVRNAPRRSVVNTGWRTEKCAGSPYLLLWNARLGSVDMAIDSYII